MYLLKTCTAGHRLAICRWVRNPVFPEHDHRLLHWKHNNVRWRRHRQRHRCCFAFLLDPFSNMTRWSGTRATPGQMSGYGTWQSKSCIEGESSTRPTAKGTCKETTCAQLNVDVFQPGRTSEWPTVPFRRPMNVSCFKSWQKSALHQVKAPPTLPSKAWFSDTIWMELIDREFSTNRLCQKTTAWPHQFGPPARLPMAMALGKSEAGAGTSLVAFPWGRHNMYKIQKPCRKNYVSTGRQNRPRVASGWSSEGTTHAELCDQVICQRCVAMETCTGRWRDVQGRPHRMAPSWGCRLAGRGCPSRGATQFQTAGDWIPSV